MFVRSLLLVALLFAAGCADPGRKLVGRWELDVDQTLELNAAGNPGAAFLQGLAALARPSGQLEFTADGELHATLSLLGQEKNKSGTWKYVRSEEQTLIITTQFPETPAQEWRVTFGDDQHFVTAPPDLADNRRLAFMRAPPR